LNLLFVLFDILPFFLTKLLLLLIAEEANCFIVRNIALDHPFGRWILNEHQRRYPSDKLLSHSTAWQPSYLNSPMLVHELGDYRGELILRFGKGISDKTTNNNPDKQNEKDDDNYLEERKEGWVEWRKRQANPDKQKDRREGYDLTDIETGKPASQLAPEPCRRFSVNYRFGLVFCFHTESGNCKGAIWVDLRHDVWEQPPIWTLAIEQLDRLQRLPSVADNRVVTDNTVVKHESPFICNQFTGVESAIFEGVSVYVNPLAPEVLTRLLIQQGWGKESRQRPKSGLL